jgi:hypothetical protein
MALAWLGLRPYRCRACGRRFQDRSRRRRALPVLGRSTQGSGGSGPERQRRLHTIADGGDTAFNRMQISRLLVIAATTILVFFLLMEIVWPESTSNIRSLDEESARLWTAPMHSPVSSLR